MKKLFLGIFFFVCAAGFVSLLAPSFLEGAGLVPCGGCAVAPDPVTGECPASQVQSACNLCHAFELANRIITFILVPSSYNGGFAFVFLLGGLLLVVAGFLIFVCSVGNPPLRSRGKTILFSTIIGLLIVYGSWVGLNGAFDFFGVTEFTGTGNWWAIQCGVEASLSMTVNPSTISGGDSATIFWDALGVSDCTASGQWSGSKAPGNKSEVVTPPSALGTYTYNLSCIGLNGNPSASVVVTVSHKAPEVGAGPDQVVTLPFTGSVTATMAGMANDDNLPSPPGSLAILWTQTSGPVGGATINTPSSLGTTISLSQVGTYEFQLSASDSEKQGVDSVVITVLPTYLRSVDVSNPGATLTNYQVKFTLDTAALISAGKMRADCGDLRVLDSNGTTILSHWLESGCNSVATSIWTKIPSLPGSAIKTIHAHYGNANLTSTSNFNQTFPIRYILASGADISTGAQNFDWFEVKAGATFNITDGTPQSITARKILVAGTVSGADRGFAGAFSGIGEGPGAGSDKSGGGYGGAGGQGCGSSYGAGGVPGFPYGSGSSQTTQMGSSAGCVGHCPGGDGGGTVTFDAQEIVVSGIVTMDGGSHSTGTNSSGGGAGGGILILSNRVNLSGTLSANGGAGDNGTVRSGGAGGGGGGRIKVFSDESISDTSVKNVGGGSGSPGGTTGGPFCPGGPGAPGTTFTGIFTSSEPTATVGSEIVK